MVERETPFVEVEAKKWREGFLRGKPGRDTFYIVSWVVLHQIRVIEIGQKRTQEDSFYSKISGGYNRDLTRVFQFSAGVFKQSF